MVVKFYEPQTDSRITKSRYSYINSTVQCFVNEFLLTVWNYMYILLFRNVKPKRGRP